MIDWQRHEYENQTESNGRVHHICIFRDDYNNILTVRFNKVLTMQKLVFTSEKMQIEFAEKIRRAFCDHKKLRPSINIFYFLFYIRKTKDLSDEPS